jgi:hypothetical protein
MFFMVQRASLEYKDKAYLLHQGNYSRDTTVFPFLSWLLYDNY